ncbi:MAG: hypothetical protein IJJ16_01765 [Mogibacterium sp.]|nr:hypothetical protein [Mogibacterium sp.]
MAEKKQKANVTETVYLQFGGQEVSLETIREAVREDYGKEKKGTDEPEDIKIYLKPEDRKVYYVINGDCAGEVELALQ